MRSSCPRSRPSAASPGCSSTRPATSPPPTCSGSPLPTRRATSWGRRGRGHQRPAALQQDNSRRRPHGRSSSSSIRSRLAVRARQLWRRSRRPGRARAALELRRKSTLHGNAAPNALHPVPSLCSPDARVRSEVLRSHRTRECYTCRPARHCHYHVGERRAANPVQLRTRSCEMQPAAQLPRAHATTWRGGPTIHLTGPSRGPYSPRHASAHLACFNALRHHLCIRLPYTTRRRPPRSSSGTALPSIDAVARLSLPLHLPQVVTKTTISTSTFQP